MIRLRWNAATLLALSLAGAGLFASPVGRTAAAAAHRLAAEVLRGLRMRNLPELLHSGRIVFHFSIN